MKFTNKLTVGLCQMRVTDNKEQNLKKAKEMINKACEKGAEFIVLPEMFNCPYNNKYFRKFAETFPNGETLKMLSTIAKDKNIYLVGGSIPEKDHEGKIYNTSFVFNNLGELIGKHRKIHLFDIDVEGGVKFKESDVLSPGNNITVFDTHFGKMGVAICYDIRFPELIRLMTLKGAEIIIIPAAFNMTTGPAHWELTMRARALDNQVYLLANSPARDETFSYVAYANSLIVDPWGKILGKLDEKEGILIGEIDILKVSKIREQLPLLKHRRTDLYSLS